MSRVLSLLTGEEVEIPDEIPTEIHRKLSTLVTQLVAKTVECEALEDRLKEETTARTALESRLRAMEDNLSVLKTSENRTAETGQLAIAAERESRQREGELRQALEAEQDSLNRLRIENAVLKVQVTAAQEARAMAERSAQVIAAKPPIVVKEPIIQPSMPLAPALEYVLRVESRDGNERIRTISLKPVGESK